MSDNRGAGVTPRRSCLESHVSRFSIALTAAVLLGACGGPMEMTEEEDLVGQVEDEIRQVAPTGKGVGTRTAQVQRTSYKVEYHGGQVMLGPVHVYLILYGDWTNNTAPEILTHFLVNLGGSSYHTINTQYRDGTGAAASNTLLWARNVQVGYPLGSSLTDADVASVVTGAITSRQLPLDPNGIYFVVGSADVDATSGLCTRYCGFHQSTVVSGVAVKYGFVGDAQRCPGQCAPQLTSPSGNLGADAMVSTMATLISDTISNPNLDGWYDRLGLDGADKCAWNYGPTYQTGNGAMANLSLGGRDYLLPRNWVMSKRGGTCALSLP